MLKNNIKKILDDKQVSIRHLSKVIDMDYSNTYNLVHRKDLDNTRVITLVKIAKILDTNVESLWIKAKK